MTHDMLQIKPLTRVSPFVPYALYSPSTPCPTSSPLR